jgi:hypothetical protein
MPARNWLTALSITLFSIAVLNANACTSTKAEPERVYSAAPAPVVQVSPTPLPSQADNKLTVAAVGDIMMGSTYPDASGLPPEDGATMLSEVKPILSAADIAFGNLEGPMLEGGATSKCSPTSTRCFAFRVPTRYGKHLKDAGFDVLSLANNHAYDFGPEGRESSMRVLNELGIAHSGKVGDIASMNVKGRRVAVIAFATYPTSYNFLDIENAKRLVAGLAGKNDIVIVSFHGGAEGPTNQHVPRGPENYLGEDRGDLRKFTHAMIDAGADLLIGHGPHVVRGMEVYRNRLIAYSLGNFATYGKFQLVGPTSLSLILEAQLATDGAFLGGKIHPALQTKPGGPRLDTYRTVVPVIRQLSMDDFGTSAIRVSDDGTISAPQI